MSKQPTLFPAADLVSEDMRKRWKHYVEFLWENGKYLNEWEADFMTSIKGYLDRGVDLSLSQSSKLGKIYKREQERLG